MEFRWTQELVAFSFEERDIDIGSELEKRKNNFRQ